ncbi:MAG: response regulator transcription factor [Acidimicrobiia bacterium]|nr:response regulator transcription factor [Acidimicrobiia bacterium]
MSRATVLVVEDDEPVRSAVSDGLSASGFEVAAVETAEDGRRHVERSRVDLVVLDIGLPDMSGLDLCRRLRADDGLLPILILSARDAVTDRVAGLAAGADDYLVKPFALAELVARLHALHRRSELLDALGSEQNTLRVGELAIDVDRRTAAVNGVDLQLTRREFDLLTVLARNRDLVLSRFTLLEKVWGYDFDVETNVVDVFVGYLRRKLAAAGAADVIRTVRGVGFVIDSPRVSAP